MGSAENPTGPAPRFAVIGYAARFPGAPDTDAVRGRVTWLRRHLSELN